MGAKEAEKALAASRRAEATLRDKLNRENVNAARLRASYTEQLGLVQKWKEYVTRHVTLRLLMHWLMFESESDPIVPRLWREIARRTLKRGTLTILSRSLA